MVDSTKDGLKRVVIDPVTRVEGHGKVTLLMDETNQIKQVRLHIVEFRGFEKFIEGRPYWELPVLVQRLCGICPVSHHLAAGKAIDQLVGVGPDDLTVTATKLRRLLHFGQVLQSHALHFFHLASPDLLFGFESDISMRNIVALLDSYPELALHGVKMRKYGQEVIKTITGKRIHGSVVVPGGMNKGLSKGERDYLLQDIDTMIAWAEDALKLVTNLHNANLPFHDEFATVPTNYMSLTKPDGALELYHGGLRFRKDDGDVLHDHYDYRDYNKLIREEVKSWSYMKFPYLPELGTESGWYRVGPLARVNNCDFISTPKAEAARAHFKAHTDEPLVHSTLGYHWARMIETIHCAESIKELLHDPELLGEDLVTQGERQHEGIGVIEAPRGTLFHHYEIDDDDIVTKANLIVSTTSNNRAMNESVRQVANHYLNGLELTEPMLNQIEVAIRAYDPCLSCATHALGKMPMQVELLDVDGQMVDQLNKRSNGKIYR